MTPFGSLERLLRKHPDRSLTPASGNFTNGILTLDTAFEFVNVFNSDVTSHTLTLLPRGPLSVTTYAVLQPGYGQPFQTSPYVAIQSDISAPLMTWAYSEQPVTYSSAAPNVAAATTVVSSGTNITTVISVLLPAGTSTVFTAPAGYVSYLIRCGFYNIQSASITASLATKSVAAVDGFQATPTIVNTVTIRSVTFYNVGPEPLSDTVLADPIPLLPGDSLIANTTYDYSMYFYAQLIQQLL